MERNFHLPGQTLSCNDEIAVYHISKGEKPNSFHIIANKIIDGKEEDMAVDDFSYNPADALFLLY